MGAYRSVRVDFWQDPFILEELTPEERYFYLYLITCPKTTQCGVYALPKKIIETETGYNRETLEKLINRFIDYGKILYDFDTSEILIINFLKYNFSSSPKVISCIKKEMANIKSREFYDFVERKIQEKLGSREDVEVNLIQHESNIDTVSENDINNIDSVSDDNPYSIDTVSIEYGETKTKTKTKKEKNISCASDFSNPETESSQKQLKTVEVASFFEKIWSLYPNKRGRNKVKEKQVKVLYGMGFDVIQKCIDRYVKTKEDWRQWQDGSTFFNGGYKDYLDDKFKPPPIISSQKNQTLKKPQHEAFDQREYAESDFDKFYQTVT